MTALEGTLAVGEDAPGDAQSGGLLPKIEPLPGTLQPELKQCGKPTCRCARGALHGPYIYRRWREGGRQRRQYVRPADIDRVQTACTTWRRLHPPAWQTRQELAWLRRLLLELEVLEV